MQQIILIILIAVLAGLGAAAAQEADADPFIWLEEIDSERVRAWVDQQNERTVSRLSADPRFEQIRSGYFETLQADEAPPPGALRQYRKMIYQLHQNADHPRGVIRQASLDSYLSGAPVWRDLIDVDALATEEGRNWYARLSFVFSPDGTRALVPLSEGGADAVAYREFDLLSGAFVEDGFITDSRRQNAVWLSNDQVLVSAALRQEEKTRSDQPRVVRFWKRGRDLESAPVVFEVPKNHILVAPILLETATARFVTIVDVPSLSEPSTLYAWRGVDAEALPLDIPVDVLSLSGGLAGLGDEIVFSLTVSWRAGEVEYAAGDIVSVDLASMIAKGGGADGAVNRIYSLEDDESLGLVSGAVSVSADAVYLSILKDVQSRLIVAKKSRRGGWRLRDIELPDSGTLRLPSPPDPYSKKLIASFQNLKTPQTDYIVSSSGKLKWLRQTKSRFDFADFVIEQHFAKSGDGTGVPYFILRHKDMPFDKTAPVLMYGYGGFGVTFPQTYEIRYIGSTHHLWLQQGGVFVLANVRGGSAYGTRWHEAAKTVNRQIVYDDFYAVARDLIDRKVTSPGKLAFIGGSNGGLSAAVAATQRPDLFGAALSLVPLTDMKRFHLLSAGASWLGEYGNPEDPEELAALLSYSPYHNVSENGAYPEVFFLTSTRDDIVHPAHARKMTAKMQAMGHPLLFYEAREGGHAMAVNDEGRAFIAALQMTYLLQTLIDTQ